MEIPLPKENEKESITKNMEIAVNTKNADEILINKEEKENKIEKNENSSASTEINDLNSNNSLNNENNLNQNEEVAKKIENEKKDEKETVFRSLKHDYTSEQPKCFPFYVNVLNNQRNQKKLWTENFGERLNSSVTHLETKKNTISCKEKSDFNEKFQINEKREAAPFPLLPSKYEIQCLISKTDQEISIEKAKLCRLLELKKRRKMKVKSLEEEETAKGVINKFGCLLCSSPYERIKAENRAKIARSHTKGFIEVKEKFKYIGDLPRFFDDQMEHSEEIFSHIISVNRREEEYHKGLVDEYMERKALWDKNSEDLSDYHKEAHESVDEWPPEFKFFKPRPTELSEIVEKCAPDVLQYKTEEDKECYLYYDENMLVKDPVFEHEYFKRRIGWTEEEEKIFLDKYSLHPKEFKKIAVALPGKCTKDVIEYYFINRRRLNLHEIDVRVRNKYQKKKKIITEGGVK